MKRNHSLLMAGLMLLLLLSGSFDCLAAKRPLPKAKRLQAAGGRVKPAEKPDPFRPFVEKEIQLKERAIKAASVSIFPLQKAGIEQFKLVGIVGDGRHKLAIVETVEGGKGRSYPVALGTTIGLNKGRVVQIQSDSIVVEETAQGRIVNRIIKRLHINEEEGAS